MFINPVYAQCPVCIVTVGGGLLLAEKLHIDPLLISIWISGLNSAIAFYIANKTTKKIFKSGFLWAILFYLFTVMYLKYSNQLDTKSINGLSIGLVVSILSNFIEKILRNLNNGKVFIQYQKVIVPVTILLLTTLIFKFFI